MNKRLQTIKYIVIDYLASLIAWFLFFIYRKYSYNKYDTWKEISNDPKIYYGLLIIPLFWILLYFFLGAYKSVYRKSRIGETGLTLLSSLIGVSFIFFVFIIDDYVNYYTQLYTFLLTYFLLHFLITLISRLIITTIMVRKIHSGEIGFRTIIIGGDEAANSIYLEIENQVISSGNKFIGFLSVNEAETFILEKHLPLLGHYSDAKEIIASEKIEEVIIAINQTEHNKIKDIITTLQSTNVIVKVIPDMYDILLGSVQMTSIFQAPLIQIRSDIMPHWQVIIKRIMDIVISIIAIIILLPVYILTAIAVYTTSKGPIFYSQERIGLNGIPFNMLKFRTMFKDSEQTGPQLSSENDTRVTNVGRFIRKVRIDEIPQFFTVLKGDMSLVGYRPERQFFIDQIVQKAPHYKLLLKIKPGITSWGQVKFGYAENVDEMVERLKYDILYVENRSIAIDIKIMLYTLIIVFQGRGK